MSAQPGRTTAITDLASWAGGWSLIFKQAGILFDPPSQVSLPLVVMGGLIIGVPGLAQLAGWWLASARSGTAGSPSPSALPASPSPHMPAPGSSGGDG